MSRIGPHTFPIVPASAAADFVFVVGRQLPTSHRRNRQRTSGSKRVEHGFNAGIDLFQPSEYSVVLIDTKCRYILSASGPLRLQRHSRSPAQHVHKLGYLFFSFHRSPLTSTS